MRGRPEWLTFRRFASATVGMTLALVILGIYTAATGAGLACSAQWPLCDGGVLPQTIPSFIEWFHRLWAMVTGFLILGTAGWAIRSRLPRRGKLAAAVAVVLLPLQVSIGAVTVTLNGALPAGYSAPTQGAHFLTALSIFTALVLVVLTAYGMDGYQRSPTERAGLALRVALAGVLVGAIVGRVSPIPYSPTMQALFYGVSLVAFAALVAAVVWLPRGAWSRRIVGASIVPLLVAMLLGRDLVYYTEAVLAVNEAAVALTVGLVMGADWMTRRHDGTSPSQSILSGD